MQENKISRIFNMENIKVSVIIPMYNASEFIEACVSSVLEQDHKNVEIIIVDDHSTDDSYQVVQRLYGHCPSIRIEKSEKKLGAGGARNKGLSLSSGQYICFLDSDDAWHSQFLVIMLSEIVKSKKNIVSCTDTRFVSSPNVSVLLDNVSFNTISAIESLLQAESACKKIFKASYLKESNILFPKGVTGEDLFFMCRVLSCIKHVRHINLPLYLYRVNNDSVTQSGKVFKDLPLIVSMILTHSDISDDIKLVMLKKRIVWEVRNSLSSPLNVLIKMKGNPIISSYIDRLINESEVALNCFHGKNKKAWNAIRLYLLHRNIIYLFPLHFSYINRIWRKK